jgi:hypothetical protein
MRIPKVKWVVIQDNDTLAIYYPCSCGGKTIMLDCIKLQSFYHRLDAFTHEMVHWVFDFFPDKIYEFLSKIIDATHGNQPSVLTKEEEDSIILYVW